MHSLNCSITLSVTYKLYCGIVKPLKNIKQNEKVGRKIFYFILLIKFHLRLSNFSGARNIEKNVLPVRISETSFLSILPSDTLSCTELVKKLGSGPYTRSLYAERPQTYSA